MTWQEFIDVVNKAIKDKVKDDPDPITISYIDITMDSDPDDLVIDITRLNGIWSLEVSE